MLRYLSTHLKFVNSTLRNWIEHMCMYQIIATPTYCINHTNILSMCEWTEWWFDIGVEVGTTINISRNFFGGISLKKMFTRNFWAFERRFIELDWKFISFWRYYSSLVPSFHFQRNPNKSCQKLCAGGDQKNWEFFKNSSKSFQN
jgi:hypothetical protein